MSVLEAQPQSLSTIYDLLESVVDRARAENGREPLRFDQSVVDEARAENEPIRFDLGCGLHPVPGFRGVDFYAGPPSIEADLFTDDGWGFTPDDSVDVFFASHFVEHVPHWNHFFTNAWRKLRAGGYFVITTPYYLSVRATQDPDHKQMISRERYSYLSKDWRRSQDLEHYQARVDFEVLAFYPVWNERYAHLMTAERTNPEVFENAMRHIPNAVDDLTVILRAKK